MLNKEYEIYSLISVRTFFQNWKKKEIGKIVIFLLLKSSSFIDHMAKLPPPCLLLKYLSIYQSINLFIDRSIYLSINPSIYLFIYECICLSINLSIYQSIRQCICLSICLSTYFSQYNSQFLLSYVTSHHLHGAP